MSPTGTKICLILTAVLPVCLGQECTQRITSCADIKTDRGFEFPHDGRGRTEINVYFNKTLIARAELGSELFESLNSDISVNNYSVITTKCQDLQLKCFHKLSDGNNYWRESCIDYVINAESSKKLDPTDLPTPKPPPGGMSVGVVVFLVICGVAAFALLAGALPCCVCWTRKRNKDPDSQLTFCRYLQNLCQTSVTLTPNPDEGEEGITSNLRTAAADEIPLSNLNNNLSDKGNQQSENVKNRTMNGASYPARHRDDPGRVNDNQGQEHLGIAKPANGWTVGAPASEIQPLLLNPGGALQGLDMTGTLTNSDQDQVSHGSLPPDTDAESPVDVKSMKNCTIVSINTE